MNVLRHNIPSVQPLFFALGPAGRLPDEVYARIETSFWSIGFKGDAFPFDSTGYYESEFGAGLFRHVVSFRALMDPGQLAACKLIMYNIESEFSHSGQRSYNLDMGYLDSDKLVLASFKPGRNKIYLDSGVFGDMLLFYEKGAFFPQPWAFEDFKKEQYYGDLLKIREKYKSEMRKRSASGGSVA